MSLSDLLDALDGYGLTVTDPELISDRLQELSVSEDAEINSPVLDDSCGGWF